MYNKFVFSFSKLLVGSSTYAVELLKIKSCITLQSIYKEEHLFKISNHITTYIKFKCA